MEDDYDNYFAKVVRNWRALDLWTAQEAMWLSFGINPHDIEVKENIPLEDIVGDDDLRIREVQIIRAIEIKKLKAHDGKVSPKDFVVWAQESGFPVVELLRTTILKESREVAIKSLGPKEENTTLRMISAIAYGQYGYTPATTAGDKAVSKMAKDIEAVGFGPKAETAEKWIKQAVGRFHP